MSMTPLSRDELMLRLSYDPTTGDFQWLRHPVARHVGAKAGSENSRGYILIKINGRNYRAHRLAFLYMTGEWPPADVDHINRLKTDNRFENLRAATRPENVANTSARANSSSGIKGVVFQAKSRGSKKWQAAIRSNGKRRSLGYFATAEQAGKAYQAAAGALYGDFASRAIAEDRK